MIFLNVTDRFETYRTNKHGTLDASSFCCIPYFTRLYATKSHSESHPLSNRKAQELHSHNSFSPTFTRQKCPIQQKCRQKTTPRHPPSYARKMLPLALEFIAMQISLHLCARFIACSHALCSRVFHQIHCHRIRLAACGSAALALTGRF